jgi:hypothetical protein
MRKKYIKRANLVGCILYLLFCHASVTITKIQFKKEFLRTSKIIANATVATLTPAASREKYKKFRLHFTRAGPDCSDGPLIYKSSV